MFTGPIDQSKYTAKWRYVEIAIASVKNGKNSLYRIQDDSGKPIVIDIADIPKAIDKYGDVGFYTSVWQYNSKDVDKATRMSSLYFDLDSKDQEIAYKEMVMLREYLLQYIPRDSIHVYFTGLKGFHIEVEALCIGVAPSSENHVLFRYVANNVKEELNLTTLDFSVYDARRIWRYPNTRHQASGLYKVELFDDSMNMEEIREYAKVPQPLNTNEQKLSYEASKWFRGITYLMEEEEKTKSLSAEERLRNFSKFGSSSIRQMSDADKIFDPKRLLDSCHTINDLWMKAEKTGHLEHEERLFLCSILSYTDESLDYLYAILSSCSDFDPNVSKAHVEDWIRRRDMGIGGKPYSCKTANQKGFGCMDCDLEVKKKWVKINDTMVETEEEARPSPVRFAYSRKGKGY